MTGSALASAYAVSVERLAQREARRQGEGAVQLIQQASAPAPSAARPIGLEGEGSHLNVIA